GEDNIDSEGSNTPPAKGIVLESTLNQSSESLESQYHDSQTGEADGRVLTAAATIEQQQQAELAASQAYLNNKAAKSILAKNRERRDAHAQRRTDKANTSEAEANSTVPEQPRPTTSGAGTFTIPREPVEDDSMSFEDIFGGLIKATADGRVTALPGMEEIWDAIQREIQMMRLLKEGETTEENPASKVAQQTVAKETKVDEPATKADITVLTDQMREMKLFMHKTTAPPPFRRQEPVSVSSAGPTSAAPAPVSQTGYPPEPSPYPQGFPGGPTAPALYAPRPWRPITCEYCLVGGHFRSQCSDFTEALDKRWVRIYNRELYWPNGEKLVADNPKETVMRRLVEMGIIPAPTPKEAEVSTHVSRVEGSEWRPPIISAEVRTEPEGLSTKESNNPKKKGRIFVGNNKVNEFIDKFGCNKITYEPAQEFILDNPEDCSPVDSTAENYSSEHMSLTPCTLASLDNVETAISQTTEEKTYFLKEPIKSNSPHILERICKRISQIASFNSPDTTGMNSHAFKTSEINWNHLKIPWSSFAAGIVLLASLFLNCLSRIGIDCLRRRKILGEGAKASKMHWKTWSTAWTEWRGGTISVDLLRKVTRLGFQMDSIQWFDGRRWCRTMRNLIHIAKKKKDCLETLNIKSGGKKDGPHRFKARGPNINAKQHEKHLGKDRHQLLVNLPAVHPTQKRTRNLSAYLNERTWSFSIVRQMHSNSKLFIAALFFVLVIHFFLPVQSVTYERTCLNLTNLFSSYYSERGRRHHRAMTDASPSLPVILFQLVEPFASIDGHQARNGFATELAKKGLGADNTVALTLRELVAISPLMAGKLIEALKESAGVDFQGKSKPGEAKASKARVTAD
ncbi:hypothetical protein PSHT_15552, partial [Puccinia striiformis]